MNILSETNYRKIQDLDYRMEKLKAQVINEANNNSNQDNMIATLQSNDTLQDATLKYIQNFYATKDCTNLTNLDMWALKLQIERRVTLYEMTSSDSLINLGYTSGVRGNTTLTLDLSSYKYLEITACIDKTTSKFIIDLEHKQFTKTVITGYPYIGGTNCPISSDLNYIYVGVVAVNEEKSKLFVKTLGFINSSDVYNERNNNIAYYITNIKGVY